LLLESDLQKIIPCTALNVKHEGRPRAEPLAIGQKNLSTSDYAEAGWSEATSPWEVSGEAIHAPSRLPQGRIISNEIEAA
jgi:hypothetical protein